MQQERQLAISIGPRVRKSPFFDATLRWGAKSFTVYNHMYMPTGYTDPVTEYWSLVNDVTLWDVACQRQVEISGPDALRFIQALTPRDVTQCAVGQCLYLVLTDADGGIINDSVMLRVGEQQFWLSPGDGDVLLWAKGVAVNAGMDVKVHEPDVSPVQLQGPKAPYVAHALFGDAIVDMKYYWLREVELDGIPLVISRTGWSGELGYELYLRDGSRGDDLWERVMQAGEPWNIKPITPSTIRSVEGGLLSYDSDLTLADNAFIIGIPKMVDLEQSYSFIGKDALQRIRDEGIERRLAGVFIHGPALTSSNHEFWPVEESGREIGHVTRCVHSPRLEKNIGYVNIPADHAEIGTELTLQAPQGELRATVCKAPWFPAQKVMPDLSQSAA